MRVLETHIDIDAAPEEVWSVLTDFDHYGEWNPFITRIEGPVVIGERLSVTIAPPGGRAIRMGPKVRAADTNRHFAWLGHLGVPRVFDGAHEFVIEPTATGGTAFTQRETFRGVLVPFVGRMLARTRDGFVAMNHALKQRAEA